MTDEEFEIKMQEVQDTLLGANQFRIVIGRSMHWDRVENTLATVNTASFWTDQPFPSGRSNWRMVGLPITVESGKSRADLLDVLAAMIRQAEVDPDLD